MSWQKFSDRARESKKVRRSSSDAVVLWWAAGNYCSEHNTDGFIAKDELPDCWRPIGRKFDHSKVGLECELRGLFIDHGDYYEVNDYLEFNPSKAKHDDKKKKDARRAAAYRDRQKTLKKLGIVTRDDARDDSRDVPSDGVGDEIDDETHDDVVASGVRHATPSRPVPSRPDSLASQEGESAGAPPGGVRQPENVNGNGGAFWAELWDIWAAEANRLGYTATPRPNRSQQPEAVALVRELARNTNRTFSEAALAHSREILANAKPGKAWFEFLSPGKESSPGLAATNSSIGPDGRSRLAW